MGTPEGTFIRITERIASNMDVPLSVFHIIFQEDYARPFLPTEEWHRVGAFTTELQV